MKVCFYDTSDQKPLKYVVIISRYQGKWVFCKHRERDTYECPGGHVEAGETAVEAARRELWEETGAEEYEIVPVCIYSVKKDSDVEDFGGLFYAEITKFGSMPDFEIERIELFETPPERFTYPEIQPYLMEWVSGVMKQWDV